MRARLGLIALALVLGVAGCDCGDDDTIGTDASIDSPADSGEDAPDMPERIEDLPIDEELTLDCLTAPVDVVVDIHGVPHVYGESLHDASVGLGFVSARDRFLQMELVRHVASGRAYELSGGLLGDLLDSDLFMRTLRLREQAERYAAAVEPGGDLEAAVEGSACGVNGWIERLASGAERVGGPAAVFVTSPEEWTATDIFTIARYSEFTSLFGSKTELNLTLNWQRVTDRWGPEVALDLFRFEPDAPGATLPAPWGGEEVSRPVPLPRPRLTPAVQAAIVRRDALLRRLFPSASGPGSNAWAVSGGATASGAALLASDPHLDLTSPNTLYLAHLDTHRGEGEDGIGAVGALFPGAGAMVQGANEHVAFGQTTSHFDLADWYLETFTPGKAGGTVLFDGAEVPLEVVHEEVPDGQGGTIPIDIEWVPHHGPLLQTIEDGALLRHDEAGLVPSWRWVGFDALSADPAIASLALEEYAGVLGALRARSIDDLVATSGARWSGPVNIVAADTTGRIFHGTPCGLPRRDPRALGWDGATGEGLSPAFVLPGTGEAEWIDRVPPDQLPSVTGESGWVASANGDPVGTTFDGNPFDDPVYLGWRFREYRQARLAERLGALATEGAITAADMQALQADARTPLGARVTPHLLAALEAEGQDDLAPFRDRLAAWTFATPAATDEDSPSPEEIEDSVATTIFEAFWVELVTGAIGDELAAAGTPIDSLDEVLGTWVPKPRVLGAMLDRPAGGLALRAVDADGESLLWDDASTDAVVETREEILVAALQRAVAALTTLLGEDVSAWRWGELHRAHAAGILPGLHPGIPSGPGIPRPGDHYTIDAAWDGAFDLDFTYSKGAIARLVVELLPDGPEVGVALMGGQSADPDSPHFADELDRWSRNELHPFPFEERDIVAIAERHIRLTP